MNLTVLGHGFGASIRSSMLLSVLDWSVGIRRSLTRSNHSVVVQLRRLAAAATAPIIRLDVDAGKPLLAVAEMSAETVRDTTNHVTDYIIADVSILRQ